MSLQLNPSFGSYGVVVSISGCDPLDPGSTPGTAIFFEPEQKKVEEQGIDPCAFCMQSRRSTI